MKITILCLLASAMAFAANPTIVGQTANYQLDPNSDRTSSMIESGTMSATIAQYLSSANPPAYQMNIGYQFDLGWLGTKQGTTSIQLAADYFTPEFLQNLKQNGSYSGPDFKAKYLGTGDATNLDGATYAGCDKILLYDIQQVTGLTHLMGSWLLLGDRSAQIENAQVQAMVYPGVPVLGAVKIDMSGTYDGFDIKAGGDYTAPH